MSDPVVSVIMPVYNSQDFLREAIDSVLNQRYAGEFQIVAVDDGSDDQSVDILRSYGDAVEVYEQENAGSAVARNLGMQCARGEFVAFLDADDVWHPDKTRLQIEHLLANPDIGLVYASLMFARPSEYDQIAKFLLSDVAAKKIGIVEDSSGWVYAEFLKESLLQTSSVIMRRSLVDAVGEFDVKLRKGQDYDYWIRATRETEFRKLEPRLSVYRLNDAGITNKPSQENYAAIIFESALARWGRTGPDGSKISWLDTKRRQSNLWFEFAYLHDKNGGADTAARGYAKAYRHAPWRFRALLKFLQCAFRSRLQPKPA